MITDSSSGGSHDDRCVYHLLNAVEEELLLESNCVLRHCSDGRVVLAVLLCNIPEGRDGVWVVDSKDEKLVGMSRNERLER